MENKYQLILLNQMFDRKHVYDSVINNITIVFGYDKQLSTKIVDDCMNSDFDSSILMVDEYENCLVKFKRCHLPEHNIPVVIETIDNIPLSGSHL